MAAAGHAVGATVAPEPRGTPRPVIEERTNIGPDVRRRRVPHQAADGAGGTGSRLRPGLRALRSDALPPSGPGHAVAPARRPFADLPPERRRGQGEPRDQLRHGVLPGAHPDGADNERSPYLTWLERGGPPARSQILRLAWRRWRLCWTSSPPSSSTCSPPSAWTSSSGFGTARWAECLPEPPRSSR